MPARRIGQEEVSVRKFDIVGLDSPGATEFIRHVGLAEEDKHILGASSAVPMVHMGPPLSRGVVPQPISVIGAAALTVDEIRQIEVFVNEQLLEYEAAKAKPLLQYVIAPHVREPESRDGTKICRRYNCAGFVIEAYRSIDINLLQTEPAELPTVKLGTLERQYPGMADHLNKQSTRERLGIPGDGPWPVVLAGYVVNCARPRRGRHTHCASPGVAWRRVLSIPAADSLYISGSRYLLLC